MISIAIDGPAGAGKSTLSRRLAQALGFLYVDTGALYRAVALHALRSGVPCGDARRVEALLPGLSVTLRHNGKGQRVELNGEDVTDKLRAPEVAAASSMVSAIPAVRRFLLERQRGIARAYDVVMDGRDIGTVVLPDARLKIFLTAAAEDRARRRFEEQRQKGIDESYRDVLAEVVRRDEQDRTRPIAPLRPADDAVVVDTTGYEFERSLRTLLALCREKLGLTK